MAIWQDFTLEFHFLELNNSPHRFMLSCINFLSQIHANLCIWWLVSFQNYKSESQLWQQSMKSDMEINLDPQNIDSLHVWGRFQVYVPHALMLHELNQRHHTFATLELKKKLGLLKNLSTWFNQQLDCKGKLTSWKRSAWSLVHLFTHQTSDLEKIRYIPTDKCYAK